MAFWIGTRKGLFAVERTQGKWGITKTAFLGDPVVALMQEPSSKVLYAALEHGHFGGKLHCSDDQGESWREIAVPKYPAKPDDVEDLKIISRRLLRRGIQSLNSKGLTQTKETTYATLLRN